MALPSAQGLEKYRTFLSYYHLQQLQPQWDKPFLVTLAENLDTHLAAINIGISEMTQLRLSHTRLIQNLENKPVAISGKILPIAK